MAISIWGYGRPNLRVWGPNVVYEVPIWVYEVVMFGYGDPNFGA